MSIEQIPVSQASGDVSKVVKTTCPYCGVGCGIDAKLSNQSINVDATDGSQDHPANFGRVCVKGSNLDLTLGSRNRLLEPSIDGSSVDWDAALSEVANKFSSAIEQYGPDSVAFYLSGQLLTEDYYVANKLMKGFIGSANVDTNSRLCMASAVVGYKRAFGADTVPCNYEDLELADLLILIGSNAAWTHPVLYQRMVAAKKQRPEMKVVVIDPRKTATSEIADLHLAIKPASDAFLFHGLLNYLVANDCIDQTYIDSYTDGFAQTKERVSHCTLEQTADVCDVSVEDLTAFFEYFAGTQKAISFYSQGINQSSSGSDKCNAIINCHLATGKLGKPGMGPFSITGQPNAMGGREVGGLANQLAAHMDFAPDDTNRVQRFWNSPTIATEPGLKAVDLFDAVLEGKVKAIWIMATNPAVSLPDSEKVRAALDKCEFVVVSDFVSNDTAKFANVVLPTTSWGEKNGTVTNSERRISRQRPFSEPAGESKHDWWQLTQVAKKMGFASHFDYRSPADVFREHACLSGFENSVDERLRDFDISALADLSNQAYDDLEPIQWPINAQNPQGTERLFEDNLFYTKNRRAQFVMGDAKLQARAVSDTTPLLLNTGRIRDQWHTMTRTGIAGKLLSHIEAPYIELHPNDIDKYGLEDGAFARLRNEFGQFIGRINKNSEIRVGDVFAPIHWTDEFAKHGVVSAVVSPEVDPFSGQPESKATPVSVEPFECDRWATLTVNAQLNALLDLSKFDYWYKAPSEQGYVYFVGTDAGFDWTSLINSLKHQNSKMLSYKNPFKSDERYALTRDGILECAIFLRAEQQDLPSFGWLASLMDEAMPGKLSDVLVSEYSSGGKTVCSCFSVSQTRIIEALNSDCKTVEELGASLKCGTNCGSCIPELKTLIAANIEPA